MRALKKDVVFEILKKKCNAVERQEEGEVIVKMLEATLREAGSRFYSISAPQVNVMKQVAIIRHPDLEIDLINPVIIDKSKNKILSFCESCVSFPIDKMNCLRSETIILENGFDRRVNNYSGLSAILIQHEVDHLNGVLPQDRTVRVAVVRDGGMLKDSDYCVCGSKERFWRCCKKK